jgi:hypothetical protein
MTNRAGGIGKEDHLRLTGTYRRRHALLPAARYDDCQRRDQNREWSRSVHSGTTRSASVVPRTPTTAAGVSRRIESGESLAMRPET